MGADVNRRKTESSGYGYLLIPKGTPLFKEKPTKGKNRVNLDIIPYIVSVDNHPDANSDIPDSAHKGNPWYKRPIWVHRSIGTDNDSVVCLKTIGKKCPICIYREEQLKGGMDYKEAIKKPQLRNLYCLIPKGHKDYDEEIHIWDIANGNFQEELDNELDEAPELGIFPDPADGKTLRIRFSEDSFLGNKFAQASRIDFEDRKKKYKDSIMDKAPNLDEAFTVLSYKDLEQKFLEIENEEEEEEQTQSEKKRKKKSLKKKGKEKKVDKKGKKKCPHGHKLGKDFDDFDDCDKCEVRKACEKES